MGEEKIGEATAEERIVVCGECGRVLTDPASVAAGIGPVCAGKE